MRAIIFRKVGSSVGRSSFTGGTLTGPLILAGDPTQPLEAATKQYVDSSLAALGTGGPISGTIPVASLPAFTGDVSSSAGTNTLTLSNTGVVAGTYAKVTVDAKGRVTAGGALADSDIPNLHWSKITTGKPTTLSGYGITDGVSKSGDSMTGPLTLSGNATNPLHAVPLQQVNEIASNNNALEFIASGAIPRAGLTVGLNANGTVSVITGSGQPESWGSRTVFSYSDTYPLSTVYDSTNNKIVIAYKNGSNKFGFAVVGTVSGTSISFGSPVLFSNSEIYNISTIYDSANQKVVIAYSYEPHNTSPIYNAAIVGAVSGDSISFGAEVVFSNTATHHISAIYDSYNQKVVICYYNYYPESGFYVHLFIIVGTVSGTSISFGAPVNLGVFNYLHASLAYDSANNKVIVFYGDYQFSVKIGTVAGNSITFDPQLNFPNITGYIARPIYDPINQKVVILYTQNTPSGSLTRAIVGTVTENNISFGEPVVFNNATIHHISAAYISSSQKVFIAYSGSNHKGTAIMGTVSGNSISFETPTIFDSGTVILLSVVYSSVNNKVVISYNDTQHGVSVVYSPSTLATNKNTFIGISQNSATDGGVVRVKIKKQVDSNQSGLIPSQLYYVSDDGTLTTTYANNPLAGVAISATKLLISN